MHISHKPLVEPSEQASTHTLGDGLVRRSKPLTSAAGAAASATT